MMKFAVLAMLAVAASATNLTPDNWDAEVAGKTVFIKFQAPWCGHCKKMKPDWEKLMKEYEGNSKVLVGDVDCTAEGKPLCDSNGVKGFPTIKHGDPASLEDYKGGRDFDALSSFAGKLKPLCSPANMDLCDDDQKAEIEKVQAMSLEELDAEIEKQDKKAKDAEETFTAELDKLQAQYKELQATKEKALEEVKESGVGLLKSVRAAKKKAAAGGAKDEL